MRDKSYFVEVHGETRTLGRYLSRMSYEGRDGFTNDPEVAADLNEVEARAKAALMGLKPERYTLVESRPILAAHRRDMREKKERARRVTEALAAEIPRRFHGLEAHVGGNNKREVRVYLAQLKIAEFSIDLAGKIAAVVGFARTEGGIEHACRCLSERIAEIRLAADSAQ